MVHGGQGSSAFGPLKALAPQRALALACVCIVGWLLTIAVPLGSPPPPRSGAHQVSEQRRLGRPEQGALPQRLALPLQRLFPTDDRVLRAFCAVAGLGAGLLVDCCGYEWLRDLEPTLDPGAASSFSMAVPAGGAKQDAMSGGVAATGAWEPETTADLLRALRLAAQVCSCVC